MKDIIRSPFFYVGDKYKLMPQLRNLMPSHITQYVEPFCGGGSSFLNTEAEQYLLNDCDKYVIKLHRWFKQYRHPERMFNNLYELIKLYGLSCSYKGYTAPEELKKQYVKTYYSHFNKTAYMQLRNDYNSDRQVKKLYLLLIYGFNHMLRFNSEDIFNLPVGNVDFNKNVYNAMEQYIFFMKNHNVTFYCDDYKNFLNNLDLEDGSFVYCDPPYLISMSEYNKLWNIEKEKELCNYLDVLNNKGISFGITNLINHKGKINEIFLEWSSKYYTYNIKSNYISFNDNTIKKDSKEVYVTNYRKGD